MTQSDKSFKKHFDTKKESFKEITGLDADANISAYVSFLNYIMTHKTNQNLLTIGYEMREHYKK
jgi:hypothetical protein